MPVVRFSVSAYVIAQDCAVYGHVIDALPCLLLDHGQEIPRPHVGDVFELLGYLVDGHGAHGHGGGFDNSRSGQSRCRRRSIGPSPYRHRT